MHQKLTLTLSMAMSLAFTTPAAAEGLALGGSLTLVSQTVNKSESGAVDDSQFTNRVDVTAEMPAGKFGRAEGKLFVHLRAGNEARPETMPLRPATRPLSTSPARCCCKLGTNSTSPPAQKATRSN